MATIPEEDGRAEVDQPSVLTPSESSRWKKQVRLTLWATAAFLTVAAYFALTKPVGELVDPRMGMLMGVYLVLVAIPAFVMGASVVTSKVASKVAQPTGVPSPAGSASIWRSPLLIIASAVALFYTLRALFAKLTERDSVYSVIGLCVIATLLVMICCATMYIRMASRKR